MNSEGQNKTLQAWANVCAELSTIYCQRSFFHVIAQLLNSRSQRLNLFALCRDGGF